MSKRYQRNGPVDYSDMTMSSSELWDCYEERYEDRTGDIVLNPNFPIEKLVRKAKSGMYRGGSWRVVYNPSFPLFLMSISAIEENLVSKMCARYVLRQVTLTRMVSASDPTNPALDNAHRDASRRFWSPLVKGDSDSCDLCIKSAVAMHQYEVSRGAHIKPLVLDPKALGWVKRCLEDFAPMAVSILKEEGLYPAVLEQATFSPNRRRR